MSIFPLKKHICSLNHPHRWKNNAPRRSKTNKNQHGQGKTGFYLFRKTPCFCWFFFVFIGF